MRREATRGEYFWACQASGSVEQGNETKVKGCGFFAFAEFDENGVPTKQIACKKREAG